jgi:PBSX family phage terminase large subunit
MSEVALQVGANYDFLDKEFDWDKSKEQIKQVFLLEGGGGSAKTYDALQFIITYCDNYYGWNKDILIGRDQYSDCKKTVLKDFIKILKMYGIYRKENHTQSHPQSYNLYGNTIFFSGINGIGSHGERHDIIYINEIMETEWDDIAQLNQRCNEMFLGDYNPMFTVHWVYDKLEPREDCKLFKSTQLMNPFLPKGQRDEMLAYEPTHPEDRHLPKKERRPHPTNIKNGTADDYLSDVYLFGLRAAPEGLIFKYVSYIDSFPDMGYSYTIDFGFTTDPTAICKYAEDSNNIWIELLLYEPTENADLINEFALSTGMNIKLPTTADSSDKYTGENKGTVEMVKDLRLKGWRINKVSKTKSVMYWLTSMKKKKIHIVKNSNYIHAKKEQENYRMKTINGIAINQPIDKFNHMWDSVRYGHIAYNSNNSISPIMYT